MAISRTTFTSSARVAVGGRVSPQVGSVVSTGLRQKRAEELSSGGQ